MSQEKVDRHKQEKANRKRTMKKQKYKSIAARACAVVVCAAIVGWGGYSIYNWYEGSRPTEYLTIDSSALDTYESEVTLD